jgi:hypothetical protein
VDGVLAPSNYPAFSIERGTVILGRPGVVTDVWASSGFIGVRTLASPTLIVDGGTNNFNNGYLSIGRGTGTRVSPQQPGMIVRNGSYVNIPGSGFVMANQNGQDNFYCEPYLTVDEGSTFLVRNNLFINENSAVSSRVDVVRGSLFQSDTSDFIRGLVLPQSLGSTTHVTFDSGSTGRTFFATVRNNAFLTFKNKSVFEFDMTNSDLINAASSGIAYFDDATLRQRVPAYQSSWFMNAPNLHVGANGMTINVEGRGLSSP